MDQQERRYTAGQGLVVRYNARRCIHFEACVKGLPVVFDPQRRPWIAPDNAEAEALAAVVQQCPTGALHVEWPDGRPAEQPAGQASVQVAADGPLFLRGAIALQHEDGTPIANDTRIALCRCGGSRNKPFCDGSHRQSFRDAGMLAAQNCAPGAEAGPLTIRVSTYGPYLLSGPVIIRNADGSEARACAKVALCRCGSSQHKPFCDGSHQSVDREIFE